MKNHLITGGAGFIGSHLAGTILQKGGRVTVYDNLSEGSYDNVKEYSQNPNFSFVEADLLDFETLKKTLNGQDVVWHLGANTNIKKGLEDTDRDLRNGIVATKNVLEAMRQTGADKILFSSSSVVYGDVGDHPLREDFGPLLPISLYGAGKLSCEGLISAYSHLFGIKSLILRLANVVGDKMSHGILFNSMRKLEEDPSELEILGDGKQEKPYILVEECIRGMIFALERSGEEDCNIYNLGCDDYTSLSKIANIIIEEMGLGAAKIKYAGGDRGWPGDIPRYSFDISKIKKLGWQPEHTSDEAVRIAAARISKQLASRKKIASAED